MDMIGCDESNIQWSINNWAIQSKFNKQKSKRINTMTELIRTIAKFGVRNDKNRGLLVETIEAENGDIYFFQFRDQPIERHCEQLQNIVRSEKVKRSKNISVNISPFIHEYYLGRVVQFKGTKLNSVSQQVQKVQQITINKEIGAMKRKNTIADKKNYWNNNARKWNDHYQSTAMSLCEQYFYIQ